MSNAQAVELTTPERERLSILTEMLGACVHRVGLIKRRGYLHTPHNSPDGKTLHVMLEEDIANLEAILSLMYARGDIERKHVEEFEVMKLNSVQKKSKEI